MRVFLTGVGCVGKTTIGAKLADLHNCTFLELDQEIERFFGTSIETSGVIGFSDINPDSLKYNVSWGQASRMRYQQSDWPAPPLWLLLIQ